jgi:hypothetical protein
MSEEKKSTFKEGLAKVFTVLVKVFKFMAGGLALMFFLYLAVIIIFHVGIGLFGGWFEADNTVLKETAKAQVDISNVLSLVYKDFGRLDVRRDHSVRAYIPKKNYVSVPYPDRKEAINLVGKAWSWCRDKDIKSFIVHMPKVELLDIETGDNLDTYHCVGF